jgi:hypothetical protein
MSDLGSPVDVVRSCYGIQVGRDLPAFWPEEGNRSSFWRIMFCLEKYMVDEV